MFMACKSEDYFNKRLKILCGPGWFSQYGLGGLGIEFWWGRNFTHPSRPALGLTQPPIQWVLGLSRG